MRRLAWVPWVLLGLVGAVAFVWLGLPTLRRLLGLDPGDLDSESPLEPVRDALGGALLAVGDAVSASPYPARWGGGIRHLNPIAAPFFAELFTRLEARGWMPKSNYPHADYNSEKYGPGPRALDIYDSRWPRNFWQEPGDLTIAFYRDLGAVADDLGLTWGGHWKGFSGDKSAWAKAWIAVGMGDMLHVEWRQGAPAFVPTEQTA